MSKSALRQRNHGAYTNPFSGVGMEFYPLGIQPDLSGIVLHESGYLAHNTWWNFPNVLSPFWRLCYNDRPGHQVVFPHGTYPLTPDHLMLIPDHEFFHCRGTTDVASLWMAFSVSRRLAPGLRAPLLLTPGAAEQALLRAIREDFSGRLGTGNREAVFHHSLALLNTVLCRPELRWVERPLKEHIRTIRHHIETALTEKLTLPKLARMAGLCVRGFSKAFVQQQGVTPNRFITQVRVREAARLLATSDATIEAVAEQTGFANRAYLSRVFKAVTGESPAAFRRNHGLAPSTPPSP